MGDLTLSGEFILKKETFSWLMEEWCELTMIKREKYSRQRKQRLLRIGVEKETEHGRFEKL